MAFSSKEKQNKYNKEVWYPKNKARRIELNYAWRLKQQKLYLDFKKSLSCCVCGENDSTCLDFHHVDPKKKDTTIANMSHSGKSFRLILKEIEKCIVLCANCHRKFHAGVIKLS